MADVDYKIVRKIGLKNTYLRIRASGDIEIRTNLTTSKKFIEAFVTSKQRWIEKQLDHLTQKELPDGKFLLFGELRDKDAYAIHTANDLHAVFKTKAKEVIEPLVETWKQRMDLVPAYIGFRNNKTRWGSCSGKDRISFNIQLAKMPLPFIEYVVVHELAHIKHKNHSKSFWKLVEIHLPDYKIRQKMAKTQPFLDLSDLHTA